MIKRLAGCVLALLAFVAPAFAQDSYPTRPIMMVVSYGAGGATDYQARIVTKPAMGALGMPIAILNRPGNGGRAGWNWFATHALPDGYTLAAYNVPHFIAQQIEGGVSYGTDSLEPIANWGADPAVLVVASESEFEDLSAVLTFAAQNPGALSLSGAGTYVGHHIAALQLEKASGVSFDYRATSGGGADALKAVIAGEVLAGINNLSDAYRAQRAGKVRILGLFDLTRHEYLPEVPTLQELGYDIDDSSVNYRGVMVPKGTPQEVIDRLADTLPKLFADPEVVSKMKAAGAPMQIMTRAEVQDMWRARQDALATLLSGL